MATEDTPEKKNRREALKTVGKVIAGAGLDHLFSGTFAPIFVALTGIAVAILVVLKTGILQIANWPTSALIVLGLALFILLGIAVALSLVWGVVKGVRLVLNLLLGALKIPLIERTRFERVTDPVMLILLFPVVTVLGWIGSLIGWIDELRSKPSSPANGNAEPNSQSTQEQ